MVCLKMPENWDDQNGWEEYYASQYPSGNLDKLRPGLGSIGGHLDEFANIMRTNGWSSVWVAGTGFSPLARIMSGNGFNVDATDISATAIQYQHHETISDARYIAAVEKSGGAGSFNCIVHDFTQPFAIEKYDVVVNVKAFQGFSQEAKDKIAKVHFDSLRPGGRAYFDTMNVQGERRDSFEQSLVDAGFYIPYFELELEYRKALRETKITHNFILGNPMVPLRKDDEEGRLRDVQILRDIQKEFNLKMKEQHAIEVLKMTHETKLASIIYSTG